MKLSPKNYWKPTPKNMRRFGDTLLILSTSFIGYEALYLNNPTLSTIVLIIGVLGKFLTNFFAEDDK